MIIIKSALVLSLVIPFTLAHPGHYKSLFRLGKNIVDDFMVRKHIANIPNPPGPLKDDSMKMVNDPIHPYIPPGPTDVRGPCPGLNTLANHNVRTFMRSSYGPFESHLVVPS